MLFLLIKERVLTFQTETARWDQGVVFINAADAYESWLQVKKDVPKWYTHAEDIFFDTKNRRIILDLPLGEKVVLAMREVK